MVASISICICWPPAKLAKPDMKVWFSRKTFAERSLHFTASVIWEEMVSSVTIGFTDLMVAQEEFKPRYPHEVKSMLQSVQVEFW